MTEYRHYPPFIFENHIVNLVLEKNIELTPRALPVFLRRLESAFLDRDIQLFDQDLTYYRSDFADEGLSIKSTHMSIVKDGSHRPDDIDLFGMILRDYDEQDFVDLVDWEDFTIDLAINQCLTDYDKNPVAFIHSLD
jgi:hypothetical protein